jgi:hypothetical protein
VEAQSSTSVMRSTATPSCPSGTGGPIELGQSPLEQAALGVVEDQRQGPVVGLAGFRRAPEAAQQFGTGRVQVALVPQGQAWKAHSSPHTGPVP